MDNKELIINDCLVSSSVETKDKLLEASMKLRKQRKLQEQSKLKEQPN